MLAQGKELTRFFRFLQRCRKRMEKVLAVMNGLNKRADATSPTHLARKEKKKTESVSRSRSTQNRA